MNLVIVDQKRVKKQRKMALNAIRKNNINNIIKNAHRFFVLCPCHGIWQEYYRTGDTEKFEGGLEIKLKPVHRVRLNSALNQTTSILLFKNKKVNHKILDTIIPIVET